MFKKLLYIVIPILHCLFFVENSFGQSYQQIGDPEHQIEINELKRIGLGIQKYRDTIYNSDRIDKNGTAVVSPRKKILESALVIGLVQQSLAVPSEQLNHNSTVSLLVKYRKNQNLSRIDSARVRLQLDYDGRKGSSYKAKDFIAFDSVAWAEIRIDSFISNITFPENAHQFKLTAQILGQEIESSPSSARIPYNIQVSKESGYIKIQFDEQTWAQTYDLEWKFIDGFSSENENLEKNATRINIKNTNYRIPIISTKGKFVARVRGRTLREDKSIYLGPWSDNSTILTINESEAFEKDKKPWQYTIQYADEGFRSDVVTFYDGTGKERQSLTRSNTKGQHLIAAEKYYDFHGRPVIQSLLTPLKPKEKINIYGRSSSIILPRNSRRETNGQIDSRFLPSGINLNPVTPRVSGTNIFAELETFLEETPPLKYIPKLNINESGEQYSANDFDIDPSECGAKEIIAKKMSNQSGAGKYYSANNDVANLHRDEIPDANGYPFIQVEYTPDNTGRIKRSGLAGESFQIGSGKETKYFYSIPSQEELYRLFGSEVGDANKYTKQIIQNSDGQLVISYINPNGQVVATGLAGNKPENLELLPDQETPIVSKIRINRSNQSNDFERGKTEVSKVVFVETEGGNLRLKYSINTEQFNKTLCAHNICYDCPKTIKLKLSNACGKILLEKSIIIGPANDIRIETCETSRIPSIDTIISGLAMGEYYFSKEVIIREEAREDYVLDFVSRDTACYNPNIPRPLPCVNSDQCIPCEYSILDGLPTRTPASNPLCSRNCNQSNYNFDMEHFTMMVGDMMPGGKYGSINFGTTVSDSIRVSIFNSNIIYGAIPFTMISPFGYKEPDGSISWVDVTDANESDYITTAPIDQYKNESGRKYTIPQNISNLEILRTVWKETWSELLVQFHPEFPLLQWNNDKSSSIRFDREMKKVEKFDQAVTEGFIRTDALLDLAYIRRDPFFASTEPSIQEVFLQKLNRSAPLSSSLYLNIYESLISQMFCNAPFYNDPSNMRNCVTQNMNKLSELNEEAKQYCWTTFKAIYQDAKQRIVDSIRQEFLVAQFNSTTEVNKRRIQACLCVGKNESGSCNNCPAETPSRLISRYYAKMKTCFEHARCNTLNNITIDGRLMNLNTAVNYSKAKFILSCGKSPKSIVLLTFLNALVVDQNQEGNKFSNSKVNLNDIPPTILPELIVNFLPNRNAKKYTWWSVIERNILKATIKDDLGVNQIEFKFNKSDSLQWREIIYFGCIEKNQKKRGEFILTAFDANSRARKVYLEVPMSLFNDINNVDQEWAEILKINGKENMPNKPAKDALCCINHLIPDVEVRSKCEESNLENYSAAIVAAKIERARFIYDSVKLAYTKKCLLGATENCQIEIEQKSYYFTLYYYDQAGNLTKTVPPEAVRTMDVNRSITATAFPPHDNELVTTYSYNSLNKKLSRLSPDGGRTLYAYDELGRAVLTQDAVLRESNEANYVKYDLQGRLVEGGNVQLFNNLNAIMDEGKIKYAAFRSELDNRATIKNDYVVTSFDRPTEERAVLSKFENSQQSNLRNRISSVKYYGTGTNLQHAIYFDYDVAGNMKEIVQDFANLQSVTELNTGLATHHRFKSIRYKYNIFTGKVNQIVYQEGNSDQFYRWYVYDANQQITAVKTGFNKWEPEIYKDIDVKYQYYMHGPIAQCILGMENIQSIDLSYTINSWLKNVNHNITQESNCLPDVLDYSLEYFQGDYKGISDPVATPFSGAQLYSGNISGIKIFNRGLDTDIRINQYKYDQLNRLVQSRINNVDANRMDLTYDKNGNIQTLHRYDGSSSRFDQLTYRYDSRNKNRLLSIEDDASQSLPEPMKDLFTQTPNNYQYDAKGRIIRDASEGNMSLQWNSTDKLKRMVNESGTNNMFYDVMGRRTIKEIRSRNEQTEREYIVRDFAGNIFAEYSVDTRGVILKSIPIYSGLRIGSIEMDTLIGIEFQNRWGQYRGKKVYELKNQIGDINVLLTDRKIPDAAVYTSDIKKATEYYPFGMIMPGRDSSFSDYRYGFQGMEQDDNFKGKGNSITTEFRQYDPRVARWLSVDPKEEKYANLTTYNAFINNPIVFTDPKGDDAIDDAVNSAMASIERADRIRAIREGPIEGRYDPATGLPYDLTDDQNDPIGVAVDNGLDNLREARPRRPRRPNRPAQVPQPEVNDEIPEDITVINMEEEQIQGSRNQIDRATGDNAIDDARDLITVQSLIQSGRTFREILNFARRHGLNTQDIMRMVRGHGRTAARETPGLQQVASVAFFAYDIYNDAERYSNGDYTALEYAGRCLGNTGAFVVGEIPIVGAPGALAIETFRDWLIPTE
jgi:RHS repeat-associated protein